MAVRQPYNPPPLAGRHLAADPDGEGTPEVGRDPGVPDAVWHELQAAREAEELAWRAKLEALAREEDEQRRREALEKAVRERRPGTRMPPPPDGVGKTAGNKTDGESHQHLGSPIVFILVVAVPKLPPVSNHQESLCAQ